jgi:threonine aldolase
MRSTTMSTGWPTITPMPGRSARGLSQINGIEVQQPETNLVFFNPDRAGVGGDKMVADLRQRGVLLAMMDGRIRACTHLDVTAAMIEETLGLVREIVRGT